MLNLLLLFLPTAVCLVFFLKFVSSKSTHRSRHLLTALSFVSALYFFGDANYYSAYEDYLALVVSDVLSSYTAPALPALVMLFLRSIVFERYVRWYSYVVLIAIPCTLGAMTLTPYLIMGLDDSMMYLKALDVIHPSSDALMEDLGRRSAVHFYVSVVAYYAITSVLCMLTLWQVCYYMKKTRFRSSEIPKFLFRGGEMEPFHVEGLLFFVLFVIFIVRLFVYRSYILEHQWIAVMFSMVISIVVWAIFHVACEVDKATVRAFGSSEIRNDGISESRNLENTEGEQVAVVYPDMLDESDCNQLAISIKSLMEVDKEFLSPTLSIEDVARQLCTNKSYISRCINKHLHMTFRDYVNGLRVEHAKQMMLSHPEYVQDEIASGSGFVDASSFNRKFKQVVGVTPRQWVLSNQ